MFTFLFHMCVDIIFGPVIDSVITGITFGVASNVLNNGQLLWSMDK